MNSWIFLIVAVGLCVEIWSYDVAKLVCGDKLVYGNFTDQPKVNTKVYTSFLEDETLVEGSFDESRKTIVIVHGFINIFGTGIEWMNEMALKWLNREEVNVILVKWRNPLSMDLRYRVAALETEVIASKISEFIMKLLSKSEVGKLYTNFHFVGHSLGAHIAGQTARLLKEKHGILAKRVTGLDPAYPCFKNESAYLRLRKSDAEFVDVIHTSSGPEENGGYLGIYDLIGHMDFYPDGGNDHPECRKDDTPSCSKSGYWNSLRCKIECKAKALISSTAGKIVGIEDEVYLKNVLDSPNINCNHKAGIYYFIDSLDLNGKKRWAHPVHWPVIVTKEMQELNHLCNNETCVQMGINAQLKKDSERVFYSDTSS